MVSAVQMTLIEVVAIAGSRWARVLVLNDFAKLA
jgi:hypothetical protein